MSAERLNGVAFDSLPLVSDAATGPTPLPSWRTYFRVALLAPTFARIETSCDANGWTTSYQDGDKR